MIAEFISAVTNPKQVRMPVEAAVAVEMVRALLSDAGIVLLPAAEQLTDKFLSVLLQHPATRGKVHDRQIAANMMLHGLAPIFTYNEGDFSGIPELEARRPSHAVAKLPPDG